ncbi:MAG: HAMP domain-containing histidine kinase [Deltaproteobacteria bacterium]|nr:HAMP domain-containing histidine kinase [Deltaproteobacteria bacterium]
MTANPALKTGSLGIGIEESSPLKPARIAAIIALLYILLISLYIVLSGKIAVILSQTVQELEFFELLKGLLFALSTGGILFLAALVVFRKIARKNELIIAQHKKLAASESLVTTGIFSASVFHDINNIVTVIEYQTEALKHLEHFNEEDMDSLEEIFQASQQLGNLVRKMMESGKSHIPGEKQYESLSQVVEETAEFCKVHKKVKGCKLRCDIQPDLFGNINSTLLNRSLMNLILNAADATDGAGNILVRLVEEKGIVALEIHDDGPGIADDAKARIFDPFYTTKEDGNGLGLLSLKTCAEQHGGKVTIEKSHLGGACFRLTFPVQF